MELQFFFEKIGLPEEAAGLVLALDVPETEYQSVKQLFWEEEESFYTPIFILLQ